MFKILFMKISKLLFVVPLLLGLMYSCTDTNVTNDNFSSDLIGKFENVNTNIQTSDLDDFDINNLRSKLDNTKNYEQSIYNPILKNENISELSQSNIENITEFDEIFSKNLITNFVKDDIVTFFKRAEEYQIFLDKNIVNNDKKNILIDAVERYKWMKFSFISKIIKIESTNKIQTRCGTCYPETACFDNCMEDQIEDQFDSVSGWVNFLWKPAVTTAFMAAECIEDCYF